ncbi:hypothetical protein C4D60_Mb07t27030 [Musa balbisiana]|uniref:Uncharacterized protein n=1 Tax=Musa balbisiana TaxID=52838 RepID=A0A4S8JKA7_MUSBA|nr:hypothetical protein C4D60_Mb07t27030 [Musa balbisiana]
MVARGLTGPTRLSRRDKDDEYNNDEPCRSIDNDDEVTRRTPRGLPDKTSLKTTDHSDSANNDPFPVKSVKLRTVNNATSCFRSPGCLCLKWSDGAINRDLSGDPCHERTSGERSLCFPHQLICSHTRLQSLNRSPHPMTNTNLGYVLGNAHVLVILNACVVYPSNTGIHNIRQWQKHNGRLHDLKPHQKQFVKRKR